MGVLNLLEYGSMIIGALALIYLIVKGSTRRQ